jgi:hypothetical protein
MAITDFLQDLKAMYVIMHRATGSTNTFCLKCGKRETFKLLNDAKSMRADCDHSYLCACGCTIYRFHEPDQSHETEYFVKSFIPREQYAKNYKIGKQFETNGFKKTIDNKFVK